MVVGRYGRFTADQARKRAQELLGRVAGGDDPAGERADARALPTLGEACDDYIASGRHLADVSRRSYRRYSSLYLGDWRLRALDAITRRDIETRFHLITERHGAVPANQCLPFVRLVYRRPCVDYEGACAIRSTYGLPVAGATTPREGNGFRLRPRFSRSGARASTR